MARLVVKSAGFDDRVIELNLGVNRLGRGPKSDFQIEHPTVSTRHCEIVLSDQGIAVRDCDATNGTFVDGRRIRETRLAAGQTLRLGEVELLVETTEVSIAIPKFDTPRPAPPVVLSDGSLICPRHPNQRATYQCTHCREVLCDACVHRLRRRGGKLMRLCPLCSHPCVPLVEEKPKKKSFLGLWRKTTKLPFFQGSRKPRRGGGSKADS
jgi:pSer/pThr/pTyr-binding forkhead associated (FHA) protein